MDKKKIEKILKCSGEICPPFKYENPLLDIDVANKLAVSFVKLLNDKHAAVNNNLRRRLLKTIRVSCKNAPDGHLCNDDYVTEMLQHSYEEQLQLRGNSDTDRLKMLDTFLIRNLKEMPINSIYPSSLNPEIIIAINNLKCRNEIDKTLFKDIIHWNVDGKNNKYSDILKSLWNKETVSETQHDDISLKRKSEIEVVLLKHCTEILGTVVIDLEDWFSEQPDLRELLKMCAISSECFQICCSILNTIFVKTDFRWHMLQFVNVFIELVKEDFITSELLYFSLLYPNEVRHIVTLLDVDIKSLPEEIKESYILCTLEHLSKLHKESENYLIMLLSHFKQWFDIYYDSLTSSV